jgi:hypothetical protein
MADYVGTFVLIKWTILPFDLVPFAAHFGVPTILGFNKFHLVQWFKGLLGRFVIHGRAKWNLSVQWYRSNTTTDCDNAVRRWCRSALQTVIAGSQCTANGRYSSNICPPSSPAVVFIKYAPKENILYLSNIGCYYVITGLWVHVAPILPSIHNVWYSSNKPEAK